MVITELDAIGTLGSTKTSMGERQLGKKKDPWGFKGISWEFQWDLTHQNEDSTKGKGEIKPGQKCNG